MPKKQSSSRLSTIAGRLMREMRELKVRDKDTWIISTGELKALCGSVLGQDEQPGNPKVTTIWIRPGKDFGWKIYEGRVQTAFAQRKADAVTIAKQQAARLKPSRVVLHVGKSKKTLKEFR